MSRRLWEVRSLVSKYLLVEGDNEWDIFCATSSLLRFPFDIPSPTYPNHDAQDLPQRLENHRLRPRGPFALLPDCLGPILVRIRLDSIQYDVGPMVAVRFQRNGLPIESSSKCALCPSTPFAACLIPWGGPLCSSTSSHGWFFLHFDIRYDAA